jgi:UDPglucose 6-dehydrogenase
MKITIHGVGYVGLVTGVCLAEAGYDVVCFDINAQKIKQLQQARCPIFEPGLEPLLEKNLAKSTLRFTDDPEFAVEHGLYQFIAVSTPAQEDGSAEMSYVAAVAENIARYMQDYKLVITKSTVPVGASEVVRELLKSGLDNRSVQLEFDIASNPEFLKEGAAVLDFMQPDRIIIGVDSQRARKHLRALYAPFVSAPEQILMMDVKSAELAKYASNAMLATRISFMNEMARLAEVLGADIDDIRRAMGLDPRIGSLYLKPGPGYGGSCFPKDMKALIHMATQHQVPAPLLTAVERVNIFQKHRLFEKIQDHFGLSLSGLTVAVWGLAFKPYTDDVREASSAVLIKDLIEAGALVRAYDPVATTNYVLTYGQPEDLTLCTTAQDALKHADCLVIVTEWNEFEQADYAQIKSELNQPIIFDGRNIFDPVLMDSLGFTYIGIGRGQLSSHTQSSVTQHTEDKHVTAH